MSKRKFGFEGYRPTSYSFDRSEQTAPHDNFEDTDLDNIDYDDDDHDHDTSAPAPANEGKDDEIDPLDAFMAGIQEEVRAAPPPQPKDKPDKYRDYDDQDYDPVESFLRAKKDLGLTLASDVLHAGYGSDEEVYAAAKAVDAGMVDYDSDDNPIVIDKKRIEPIPPLDHDSIDYDPFNKDFYEANSSISGILHHPSHN